MALIDDEQNRSTKCGLFSWRPQWLQRFATPRAYLTLYALLGIVQGITFSYASSVLSTIEKQFDLKSKEVAWIYSGNEFTCIHNVFANIGSYQKAPIVHEPVNVLWCSRIDSDGTAPFH